LLFCDTEVNAIEEDRLPHIRIEVDIIEREDFIVIGFQKRDRSSCQLALSGSGFGDRNVFGILSFLSFYLYTSFLLKTVQ